MARRTTVTCLILGLLAAASAAPFDFYYLMLMWPGSYCTNAGGCCMPKYGNPAEDFHVESFQTFNLSINRPAVRCKNDSPFDINKLDKIGDSLKQHWSDIKCPSGDSSDAWKSAWNSFGVCSGLNQLDYFKAALDLRKQADVLGALGEQGIRPDSLYSPEDIKRAVRQKLGVTPVVACRSGPGSLKHLYQVILCVDADAKTFIECPKLPAATCPDSIVFQTFHAWMLANSTAAAFDDSKKILLPTETALH
ncbi:unnamed protein product [Urochloa decumbens]|uniref:Uncharacterized protein n=1 Tax=Urochloa decumbens TaxID=240449 RepID=A0ABC9FEC9_9POAL